ncbi:MAG TPA: tetratricopeptide repeat protein [Candidatus Dormibacteraeota bacterium]|nr:tetratricopeptide repeat protein [Candidatus Dormibacteraeota bacterium]
MLIKLLGKLFAMHRILFSPVIFFRAALLIALTVLFSFPTRSADEPAELLKSSFESAKAALAAGNEDEARRQFERTVALGLRQVANLAASQSRFEEANRELEEALRFAPADQDIAVDAAVASFRAGDVKKARQLAQSVVEKNPGDARAQNVLGRIDLYLGDFAAAIKDLKAAVAQNEEFETSYFLGLAYLKAKQFSDAQQWFQHLQQTMGDSAALHVLLGRAYSIARYPESAAAEFRKAIQLDPKYPRAHSLLGYSILEFRGEEAYPQARLEFERELKIQPEDYNALLLLGISDVALREFGAAEAALLHATRLRPKESFAYLYLGETASETKRCPLAVNSLGKYLRLVHDPEEVPRDVSRAYYLLGQCLRRLNRNEEAQKALENSQRFREKKFRYDAKHIFDEPGQAAAGDSRTSDRVEGLLQAGAVDSDKAAEAMAQGGVTQGGVTGNFAEKQVTAVPQPAETKAVKEYRAFVAEILASSYNDLGVMHAKAADFAGAAENFKQAAAWNPLLPGLDRNWGLASFRAEQYADAVAPLERQLKAHADDSFCRQLLGLSYSVLENYAKVVSVLQPFLDHPPDDPGLLFAWGTALIRMRQPDTAQSIFKRLLEQNADNAAIHLLLGQAHAQQLDYPNALAELKTALQLDPQLLDAHYYMGLVYLHQGEFESAAQEFRAELQLQPGNHLAKYHLGYGLLAQGHAAEAIPILRDVIKALPRYELAYFELGRALLDQGDSSGAIENLETAKNLAPEHDAVYFQLSRAYRRANRMQEAAQALAQYQKLIEGNRAKKRESLEMNRP